MGATAVIVGAAVVGAAAAAAMAPGSPKAPDAPAPPAQQPASQAAKTPDASTFKSANQDAMGPGGPLAGNSSTLLTGPGGIDTSLLNLGRSTLLGQ